MSPRSQTVQEFSIHLITPVTGADFLLKASASAVCMTAENSLGTLFGGTQTEIHDRKEGISSAERSDGQSEIGSLY